MPFDGVADRMKLCVLLSGGKDSNYALHRALMEGHAIACIVVVKPDREDSWLFHSIYPEIAVLQAEAMGLGDRVYLVRVSGEKELEVEELEAHLLNIKREVEFEGITIGGIASVYQLKRFEKISKRLGVKLYAPLWGVDQAKYMRRLIEEGFEFIISKISTMGLPKDMLGKIVTRDIVEKIIVLSQKYGFNAAFEGGEAETIVVNTPYYKYRICIEGRSVTLHEFEHVIRILRYWLGEKDEKCLFIS